MILKEIQYNINKFTGSCSIAPLYEEELDELDLFRVDEDPPYEYIGRVRE